MGSFDQPVYATSPPGKRSTLVAVERYGSCGCCGEAASRGARSPICARACSSPAPMSTGIDDSATASGTLLRLDPRTPGAEPETYATGLRNPWRFSFDRATGTLLIGDVGGSGAEEIDVLAPGAAPGRNFGWPSYEGDARRSVGPELPARSAPALERRHSDGWCAVTGGYVTHGHYLYADLCRGRLWSARLRGTRLLEARPLGLRIGYPVSFGQDGLGRVHVISFDGGVYRLAGL